MSGSAPELPRQSALVRLLFPFVRLFGWALFLLLGPLRVRGACRVPRQGGLLVLSNHLADVDPIAVQLGCPRTITYMAKSDLFPVPILGAVLRAFGAFPVNRGEPDRGAIKLAIACLKEGRAVGVFPEGELSPSGDLLPLKPGVVLILRSAGVPVICARLRHTNRVLPYGKLVPRPAWRRVRVEWSEPRTFDRHASPEEVLEWAAAWMRGDPA